MLLNLYGQENYSVRSITFLGNDSLSSEMILEQIQHYPTSWFKDVILFEDPFLFSKDIFEKDIDRIIRLYQREGFIDAAIKKVDFIQDDENKKVELKISINEGTPVNVDSIKFIGSIENKKLIPDIAKELNLSKGKRFRDKLISNDKNLILNKFVNNGYPYVDANYLLSLDTIKSEVTINWQIKPGELSRFGDILFNGNTRTEADLLEEKLTFSTGDIYSVKELDSTQRNIYDLGLFYIVSLNAELNNPDSNLIHVKVNIEEAPQFNTKLGIGYGRDEKFRSSLNQDWLSFLGGARQLNFKAKYSSLEPYNLRLSLLQPDFIWERTTLTATGFLQKQKEPSFTIDRLGIQLGLYRPFLFNISGSVKYTFENNNLDLMSISKIAKENFDFRKLYNKSSIEIGFERITSTPIFNPYYGSSVSIALHYSGLGLGSKYHFFRPTFDFRKYKDLTNWLIFAFKIKMGSIFSYDNDGIIPFEERFYSGGSSSIRGWGRFELGPSDILNKPIGGKSLLELNAEFRYPIYSIVSGVVFLDFGNVWKNELTYKFDDLRYSSGWGLRVDTPIGPIRLDLAIPVFEGAARLQYFISVGQAF